MKGVEGGAVKGRGVIGAGAVQGRCHHNKIAFQYDVYRPRIDRISQHALCRGVHGPGGGGVHGRGGAWSQGGWGGIPVCTEAGSPPL